MYLLIYLVQYILPGDDKELYKSKEITKSSELDAKIEIDVTGIDDLKTSPSFNSFPQLVQNFFSTLTSSTLLFFVVERLVVVLLILS